MKGFAGCVTVLCAVLGAVVVAGCTQDFSAFDQPYLGAGDAAAVDSFADGPVQPDAALAESAPDRSVSDGPEDSTQGAPLDAPADAPPADTSDGRSGCGTSGSPCCAGAGGGPTCGPALVCDKTGNCVACGASGEPCCPGGMCSGTTCHKNVCR
jgi:hypothetical protein